jgi:hypothetical protein
MDADHSIELGPNAPALEIPWRDPEGRLQYFDLRANPEAIEHLPETKQFPALREFLFTLNTPPSYWQTAKCDVWSDEAIAAENLYDATHIQSSYVDLVLATAGAPARASLDLHQRLAQKLAEIFETEEALEATADIVVRRCYFHRYFHPDETAEDSTAGYCLTLFLTGYGTSASQAQRSLERALEFAARCLLQIPSTDEWAKAREVS